MSYISEAGGEDTARTKPLPDEELLRAEALFKAELSICLNEVEKCNQVFFTFMTIHGEYADRAEVRDLVDASPFFMRTVLGSLQESMFIALGRLFDENSAHSLNALHTQAMAAPGMFSMAALERRKIASSPQNLDWLPAYMEDVYVPVSVDFRSLRKQLAAHRKIYIKKLHYLRCKWFAHREIGGKQVANDLLAKTEIAELESMMTFVSLYQRAFQDLFDNGNKPLISDHVLTVNDLRSKGNGDDYLFTIQGFTVWATQKFFDVSAPKAEPSLAANQ